MGGQEAVHPGLSTFPSLSWPTSHISVIEGSNHRQPLPTPPGQPFPQEPLGKDKQQTHRVGDHVSDVKGLMPAGHSLEGPSDAVARNMVPHKGKQAARAMPESEPKGP